MLKSERHSVILKKVAESQFVHLEELVDLLESSESTIRRDLDELEAVGNLRRVHGGAEAISNLQSEETLSQKSVKNIQQKEKIAQKAASFIKEQDVIFLDAGTSTQSLIPYLVGKKVTVVTNSIHHAARLVDGDIKTMIIGGFVKESTDASIGSLALEQLAHLNFDKAFLGMNGIDQDYFTTPDAEEAGVKRQVLMNAKETFILADESKFGHVSFAKVAETTRATIITNQSDHSLLETLKEKTEVFTV